MAGVDEFFLFCGAGSPVSELFGLKNDRGKIQVRRFRAS